MIFKRRNYIETRQFYYFGGGIIAFIDQKIACFGPQPPKMSYSSWALQDRHSLTYKQSWMTKGLFPKTPPFNPSSPVLKLRNIKHTFLINKHVKNEEGFCEWQLLTFKINNSAT